MLERAREVMGRASAGLITAGAGMGVDSGLPDFRGNDGFWKAYPPFARLGLGFVDLANPAWFVDDPALAWGFYGHRLELYRRTPPHAGFARLKAWADSLPGGAFVFTSNVDGHFQRAGFAEDRVMECHGSIHWLQCVRLCGVGLFSADGISVDVDEATFRARSPLPHCPGCGGIARPAILMFGDGDWDESRSERQSTELQSWLQKTSHGLVVVECGAGTAIPTVRNLGERLASQRHATLIRINPREPDVPAGHIGLPLGASAALSALWP